ncbi:poly(ADP-ribose) polymerase domain protein [Trifolium medium]|uniref:Poly(ADP-ribose) polymerase domain protein n=1 Tax=Trifolium medium TaxID=97028 RepID=A0A392PDV7_9FABA|nr:poly(ADP-ribose) polymerase domain protein [Trifolium medium]
MLQDEFVAMVTSAKGEEVVAHNLFNSNYSKRFLLRQKTEKIDGKIGMLKVYHESLLWPFHSLDGGSSSNVKAKESTPQSSSKGGREHGKNAKVREDSGASTVMEEGTVVWHEVTLDLDWEKVSTDSESDLELLCALKDDLTKHVTAAELREMLDANDQDSTGSELDLRDHW